MTKNLKELLKSIRSERRLFYASFELTYECNFACKFCYNPVFREGQKKIKREKEEKNLSLEEIFKLFSDLKRGGVLYLTITGGEPMVHKNFFEVMEKAKEEGFVLRLFTNGSLIGKEEAKKLNYIFPELIEISLYGANREGYRKSCGRPEAFQKVMNAICYLKEYGLNVLLKVTLTNLIEEQIEELFQISNTFNLPLYLDPNLTLSDEKESYPLDYQISLEVKDKILKDKRFKIPSKELSYDEGDFVCNIGKNLIHIDPYGNIYPCIQYKEVIGNIRKDDIVELFQKSPRLKELMELSRKIQEKRKVEGKKGFHCMGRAKLIYDDEEKEEEF